MVPAPCEYWGVGVPTALCKSTRYERNMNVFPQTLSGIWYHLHSHQKASNQHIYIYLTIFLFSLEQRVMTIASPGVKVQPQTSLAKLQSLHITLKCV